VTAAIDLTDSELDEIIGDGTCTHLPFVRMALEIRRRRKAEGVVTPEAATWEIVCEDPYRRVRRFSVHGGHLYQIEIDEFCEPKSAESGTTTVGWGQPVFVPSVSR